jgi:hypothetical protein
MADELVDHLENLAAARRFPCMDAAESRSLRSHIYVRMQYVVCRSTYVHFRRFWGLCGEISRNVFLLLFMVLWALIFAMLCKRAVLMLWHAFLFLGLRHVRENGGVPLISSLSLVVSTAFSCKEFCSN